VWRRETASALPDRAIRTFANRPLGRFATKSKERPSGDDDGSRSRRPQLPPDLAAGRTSRTVATLVIAPIGIPGTRSSTNSDGPWLELLTRSEWRRDRCRARASDSTHKGGDFGGPWLLPARWGALGAADHLAATGALRSGAGLVTIATPGRALLTIIRRDGAAST